MEDKTKAIADASIDGKGTQDTENLEELLKTSQDVPVEPDKKEEDKVVVQKEVSEVDKLKKIAGNYKIRAEKAEEKLKLPKEKASLQNLSVKDLSALVKADINEDDYDDIFDYAHLKGIPVVEALKAPIVKALLTEKVENRATAEATSTGNKIAGQVTPSAEDILQKAEETKEIPDSDADITKLVEARLAKKQQK